VIRADGLTRMIVNVVERAQVEVTIVATDRNCTSGRVPRRTEQRAVSERVLSDIFAFPRKSFTYFHFTDRSSWLGVGSGHAVLPRLRDNRGDSAVVAIRGRLVAFLASPWCRLIYPNGIRD
jgi:hypothetical protein